MCRTAWALENQADNIARLAFSTMMCEEQVRPNIEGFTFVVLVKYLIQSAFGGSPGRILYILVHSWQDYFKMKRMPAY